MNSIREIFTLINKVQLNRTRNNLSEVINLTLGQPHLPSNSKIDDALKTMISKSGKKGIYDYSDVSGRRNTRILIMLLMQSYYPDLLIDEDNVMCTNGANQANWNAIRSIISPGMKAITFSPYFGQYKSQVEASGGSLISIDTTDRSFRPNIDELDQYLSNDDSIVLFILNNPTNPSGIVWTEAELASLAHLLEKYPNLYILQDEVYRELSYVDFSSLLDIAPKYHCRIITTHSLSKSLAGAPAVRIGMVLSSFSNIEKMKAQQMNVSSELSVINQEILKSVILDKLAYSKSFASWENKSKKAYTSNIKLTHNLIKFSPIDLINSPVAGIFMLLDCNKLIGSTIPSEFCSIDNEDLISDNVIRTDSDLTIYLLLAIGVAVVPGSAFGLSPTDGIIRLSMAVDKEKLIAALKKLINLFK